MRFYLFLLLHESVDELSNFVCGGVESEVACVENVDFGFGHIPKRLLSFRARLRE
jgi:hypothetical protein